MEKPKKANRRGWFELKFLLFIICDINIKHGQKWIIFLILAIYDAFFEYLDDW